jgi:hypothetical protein
MASSNPLLMSHVFTPGRSQQNAQKVWSSAQSEITVGCVWVIRRPKLRCVTLPPSHNTAATDVRNPGTRSENTDGAKHTELLIRCYLTSLDFITKQYKCSDKSSNTEKRGLALSTRNVPLQVPCYNVLRKIVAWID